MPETVKQMCQITNIVI